MKIVITSDLQGNVNAVSALPETDRELLTCSDATAIAVNQVWDLGEGHTGLSK